MFSRTQSNHKTKVIKLPCIWRNMKVEQIFMSINKDWNTLEMKHKQKKIDISQQLLLQETENEVD